MRRVPMSSPAVHAAPAWLLLALALFPAATHGADCIDYADYLHSVADLDLGAQTTRDVAVSAHYAFACVIFGFNGIRVVDISNPAAPWIAASIPLPSFAEGIAVAGNYAYVACDSGLHVLDIANPLSPVMVGSVATLALDVVVAGNYAYVVGAGSGLRVVDVSNPAAPAVVGSVDTPGTAAELVVQGAYVYVADGNSGLQIVDVSNPSLPAIVGTLDTPSRVGDVAVAGMYAYLATVSGLGVVDISNPHAPVEVGFLPRFNGARVEVSGTYVYFGVNGPSVAQIMTIDVSKPTSPAVIGNVSTRGNTQDLVIAGDHAYRAYMWTPYPNGSPMATLEIFDISNPASPGVVGSVPIPDPGNDDPENGVAATDTHGFVAAGNAGLQVVDLSEPSSPVVVASMDTPSFAEDVAVSGNYAYVADSDSGLLVVDIANPASPSIIGSANTPGAARGVAISGSHAYVADSGSGLQVIDISNPAWPAIVGSVDVSGTARAVAVSGTYDMPSDQVYAYVVASSGLKVVDVSDPTVPLITGSVDFVLEEDVAVSDNYALVVTHDPGSLKIVDVSEPWTPALVGTFDTPNRAMGVAVSGTDVYIVDVSGGLQVVDITIPWDPELTGSIATPEGLVYGVAVSDPAAHAYITLDDTFLIYPAQCPLVTAVEITSFEAVPGPARILLRWSTASESYHLGFRVHRSLSREGDPGPSISGLIPPPGPYEFLDARVNPGTTYFYRLEALDRAGDSELYGPIEATAQAVPAEPAPVWTNHLAQSRPNPFRPEARPAEIHFTLAEPGAASLRVFDATGRQTRLLMEGTLAAGEHLSRWDGRNDAGQPVSSGIYFYRLDAGTFSEIQTLVTIR